jgi:hypothetical protein
MVSYVLFPGEGKRRLPCCAPHGLDDLAPGTCRDSATVPRGREVLLNTAIFPRDQFGGAIAAVE